MVTIKDISKISGYSVTTVSKALNNYPDIAESTKKTIKKICLDVGYIPNAQAQGLVSKKSYTIGIIFEETTGVGLQHPLFSKILEAFKNEVEKAGYDIMFLSKSNTNGNGGSYYEHSMRKQVEAILVLCAEFNSEEMNELYAGSLPIVMIDFMSEYACNVTSDNQFGIGQAVSYLANLKHKKIAHIHGALDTYIGGLRLGCFRNAMKANHLTIKEEYFANGALYTKEAGFSAMNSLLKLNIPPTAVVCASDMLAIGAIQAIKRKGLKVPRDISIIGFDGIDAGQLISPMLTTIRQDTVKMGTQAAKNILKMIKLKKRTKMGETIQVETNILEGETTKQYEKTNKTL